MNVLEHLRVTLTELLREDEQRVFLGEDVVDGGMLGLSRDAAADEGLRARLLATPLTPTTALAHAAGLALGGARPIVLLGSAFALVEGIAALREAALLPWRTGNSRTVPMLVIAPCGPGFGLGADAVEAPEALLSRIPELRVFCVGQADEAAATLRAAAEFWHGEHPTVLLVPRSILLREVDPTSAPRELSRAFGAPQLVRAGAAATVFAWGQSVDVALAAVAESGLDVGVVNVEALAPLDRDGLLEHAKSSGKIVIAHHGPREHGLGAELAALFAEEAILYLDAPVTRVTGADAPLRHDAEEHAAPSVERVTQAIVRAVNY